MADSEAADRDPEAKHHASYHGLLHSAPPSPPSRVDAIIVPTSRPAATLVAAVGQETAAQARAQVDA